MPINFRLIKWFVLMIIVIIISVIIIIDGNNNQATVSSILKGKPVTVYRSKGCGCCANYVKYLQRAGVQVEVKLVEDKDMPAVRKQFGVSDELSSCHTTRLEGYTVEGHIPLEAIEKLLTDKPKLAGIVLPEMPAGSPGMPGRKTEPFNISGINLDGTSSSYLSL